MPAESPFRFASLGSGSGGNGTLVCNGETRVLVDCGFSVRETERRLARLGCAGEDLSAVIVTHEHDDHIRGVRPLARRYGLPVYSSAGTAVHLREGMGRDVRTIVAGQAFAIEGLEVMPYAVPHDAAEPCQYVFGDGARRFGMLTDAGHTTAAMTTALEGCDALMVECNYDEAMLEQGLYPRFLKQRVGGDYGHLSNDQAGRFLRGLDLSGVQYLAVAHVSRKNNTEALLRRTLSDVLGFKPEWPVIADQDVGLDWCVIN